MSKKRPFRGREAYKGTSSPLNGGRKSPIKIEIRKDFYLTSISFAFFNVDETFFIIFSDFFGLAKYDSSNFYSPIKPKLLP